MEFICLKYDSKCNATNQHVLSLRLSHSTIDSLQRYILVHSMSGKYTNFIDNF